MKRPLSLTVAALPGKVMSTDLTEGMKAATVQGGEVTITLEGGPKVNGAAISTADIEATNGVIHVIDTASLAEVVAELAKAATIKIPKKRINTP